MSTTSTTTLPVRPPGTTNKPKLINVTESVVLDKNCATGDGAADNDSGYGSAALNTPKTASSGSSDTVPDRNHASAGYPLTTSSDLKVFKKDVDDATWTRYKDVSERIQGPLLAFIKKSPRVYRQMALRLVVLGRTEEDARPRIVILCHPNVQKKVKKFFNQQDIRNIYQPEDGILQSLEVEIIAHPLEPKTTADGLVVHFDADARDVSRTLCGTLIKIDAGSNFRITTLGGLVKANKANGSYALYGMIAGHAVEDLTALESVDKDETFSGDESTDESSDEDDDTRRRQLGAPPAWPLGNTSLNPSAIKPTKRLPKSWTALGRTLPLASTMTAQYLDWALLTIDNVRNYERNCIRNFAGTERGIRSGDLVMPFTLHHTPDSRSVVMMSGVQGLKKGVLSLRPSHVLLGPGTEFVSTYLVTLNDGAAIVDGDSGSWVVDEKTHEVYGHLVASDMFGEGYVIPLYATFHDMQIRLDVESVDLPSAIDIACTTIEGVGSLLDYVGRRNADRSERPNQADTKPASWAMRRIHSKRASSPNADKDSGYSSLHTSPIPKSPSSIVTQTAEKKDSTDEGDSDKKEVTADATNKRIAFGSRCENRTVHSA